MRDLEGDRFPAGQRPALRRRVARWGPAVLAVELCAACQPWLERDVRVEEFELGVDDDLEAAAYVGQLYAVGSNYVVSESGATWDLGAPLHDIEVLKASAVVRFVVVVGDDGLVALAPYDYENHIHEFTHEQTGINADLVAVAGYIGFEDEVTLVVVGENGVAIGQGDPESAPLVWTAPQSPPGGWGHLQDVRLDGDYVCVLGDAGALFCTSIPALAWERIDLDTDANLTQFCEGHRWAAVGADGTFIAMDMAERDISIWFTAKVGNVDLVACSSAFSNMPIVLGANRTIYEIISATEALPLVELGWQPLAFDRQMGLVMAGEGGRGAYLLGIQRG